MVLTLNDSHLFHTDLQLMRAGCFLQEIEMCLCVT